MMTGSRILACLIVLTTIKQHGSKLVSKEADLLNFLFKDYNPNARPVTKASDPVNLRFDIALRQLLDFNERKQIMTTNVWVRHYWNDPLLVWNSSQWEDITYLAVDPNILWKPDITLYNNAEREFQGFDEFGKTRVNIYNNGLVVWLLPVILRSQCKMDLTYFPFDEQHCPLLFGSWAYDGGSLDFINRNPAGDLSSFSESGEFAVNDFKAVRHSTIYQCCPNPYYTIEYTVNLTRKVKFYFYNLVIPGVLIALLSCFSFCLPPNSGERTGLIITNFLSISVYILMVSDSVPPSSNVPLLVKFYTALIAEIGFALMLNCIIIPLAARNTPMPKIIKFVFLEKIGFFLLCRRKNYPPKRNRITGSNLSYSNSLSNADIYFERTKYQNGGTGADNNGYANGYNLNKLMSKNSAKQNGSTRNEDIVLRERIKTLISKDNTEICDKLQNIINMMSEDHEEKQNLCDWEELTVILDRLFFCLFVLSIIITVSVLLNQAPKINL